MMNYVLFSIYRTNSVYESIFYVRNFCLNQSCTFSDESLIGIFFEYKLTVGLRLLISF